MLILDLYCGAGLVADGLIEAGWKVVGVDLDPQPRYPGPFLQHNALTLDPRFLAMFDAIWASPPCLRDTALRHAPGAKGEAHPELIPPTRAMLKATGKPFVIENVVGAALENPAMLCGSMFDLGVTTTFADRPATFFGLERHRLFEANFEIVAPGPCNHVKPTVGVYGGHARVRAKGFGGRKTSPKQWPNGHVPIMRDAMGLRERGLTGAEISQGIPPAFARWIGRQIMEEVRRRRAA